jgi:hypothetical protein
MVKKKSSSGKTTASKVSEVDAGVSTDRIDKIMNLVANSSIILMSVMMGAFSQVMVKATGAMASGMAGALGGKEAEDKVTKEIEKGNSEVEDKMKEMVLEVRKDIYSQIGQKRKEMEKLLGDPVFDAGPKIIEKYDVKLPKLTEKLDDGTLSAYTRLLVSEDPGFAEMFKQLTNWLNSLPKPEEKVRLKKRK